MSTKRIRVLRMDGSRVLVEVAAAQHYEVNLDGPDPDDPSPYSFQQRHEIIVATDARGAKAKARGVCVEGETVGSARKLTLAEVAVLTLNGAHVVA